MKKVKYCRNKQWRNGQIKDLRKGDLFRLVNENEDIVVDVYGNDTFIATCDAYIGNDGSWQVEVEDAME